MPYITSLSFLVCTFAIERFTGLYPLQGETDCIITEKGKFGWVKNTLMLNPNFTMSFHPKFTNRNWVHSKIKNKCLYICKSNNFNMYKRETEYIRDHMQKSQECHQQSQLERTLILGYLINSKFKTTNNSPKTFQKKHSF